MSLYLSAERIADAVTRLGNSRAKGAAFLDFLIIKRTFKLKGANSVAIAQSEPAYIKALTQFASCNTSNAPIPLGMLCHHRYEEWISEREIPLQ